MSSDDEDVRYCHLIGSMVGVKFRWVYPKTTVTACVPNDRDEGVCNEMLVTRFADMEINHKEVRVAMLKWEKHPTKEFYARPSNLTIINPPSAPAPALPSAASLSSKKAAKPKSAPKPTQPRAQENATSAEDDTSASEVDHVEMPTDATMPVFSSWNSININARSGDRTNARFLGHSDVSTYSLSRLFFILWPLSHVSSIVIPAINASLAVEKKPPIDEGELYQWIGLWLLMSLHPAVDLSEYWTTTTPDDDFSCKLRLNKYMSRNRFQQIKSSFRFVQESSLPYRDKFYQLRQFQFEWNANMRNVFTTAWLTCLDESMVPGANTDIPGYITVKRKPTPQGNEYHTMACATTRIINWVELVEGKDRPSQRGPLKYSIKGKTVGLLLRAVEEAGMLGSGKSVVLDSGFGFLKGIIELLKHGVYSVACFKKKRYWPWGIDGDELLAKVSDQVIGTTFTHQGTLDGLSFYSLVYRDSKHIGMHIIVSLVYIATNF
jgi:hypothetical protein